MLQQVLAAAHTYNIHAELVSQLARPRLPELGTGHHLAPLDALKAYIANQPHLEDISTDLVNVAQALLISGHKDHEETEKDKFISKEISKSNHGFTEDEPAQLRLL
jgi:exonuclease SbcD